MFFGERRWNLAHMDVIEEGYPIIWSDPWKKKMIIIITKIFGKKQTQKPSFSIFVGEEFLVD